MAKFNPNKIKAFQDFLELQNYIRSRNRKRLFIGLALAGGAYLYSKAKTKKVDDEVPSSRENGYIDYSRRPKKRSDRTSKEVKYYEK